MPPSLISKFDPRLKEIVDRLIREGRASIDDILNRLEEMLGEEAPSRASVGRYCKSTREQMERYRQAQAIAATWVKRLEDEPTGDIGRLNAELLRTLAFQAISRLSEQEIVACDEIGVMARAVKDIATADKSMAERELRIRKELIKEAVGKVVVLEGQANQGKRKLDAEMLRVVKEEIYGLAA
jgi:uncharacterized protein DUF3486